MIFVHNTHVRTNIEYIFFLYKFCIYKSFEQIKCNDKNATNAFLSKTSLFFSCNFVYSGLTCISNILILIRRPEYITNIAKPSVVKKEQRRSKRICFNRFCNRFPISLEKKQNCIYNMYNGENEK